MNGSPVPDNDPDSRDATGSPEDSFDRQLIADVRRVMRKGTTPAVVEAPACADPPDLPRYRIVRRIGEGGMGIVYEAVQHGPQRTVALKLIKPDLLSPEAVRRFVFEAEVLGRLDHPGIARIHEAGTFETAGVMQPFFAMEFVCGRSLVEHARPLPVGERLELVARVCDAVQHAHQMGVIHRDLKPSNILVTVAGQPKILDFGVARAADRDARASLGQTQPGRLLGTLCYMSPEQVTGDPDAVDTRTDVHALGVLLFEVLTGQLPYALEEGSVCDAVRLLDEGEPRRLGTLDPRLRGDLDAIASMAVAREKERRYPSAAALAADLRRHLADEPITARAPSSTYVLRKFARRHKGLVGVCAAALVVLVAALAMTAGALRRARGAEAQAKQRLARVEREAAKARAVNDTLQYVLRQANPYQAGKEPTIRAALDAAARRVEQRDVRDPAIEAAVRFTLGAAYNALGLEEPAATHLRRSRELYESLTDPEPAELGNVLYELAQQSRRRGDVAEAERLCRRALELCRTATPPRDADLARHLHQLAALELVQGRIGDAERRLGEAVAAATRGGDDGRLAYVKETLAQVCMFRGETASAQTLWQEALELHRARVGDDHPEVANVLDGLAGVARARQDLERAEELSRRVLAIRRATLGGEHPDYARALAGLADVACERGEHASAEELYRQALAILRQGCGEDDMRFVQVAQNFSHALCALDRLEEAEVLRRKALAANTRVFGATHPDTALALRRLTEVLVPTGRAQEAADLLATALEQVTPLWTDDRVRCLAQLRVAYAAALSALARHGEAVEHATQGYAILVDRLGREHSLTREARTIVARVRRAAPGNEPGGTHR